MSRSNSEAQKQTNGFPPDILVGLDRAQPRGLREQLERELRGAIQDGRISAGTRLPPSRTLADDLGVARSVVVEAYGHLVADGYLEARQGSVTRVLPVATSAPPAASPDAGPTPTARFIGGLPDPAYFPRLEWQRHYRAALTALPNAELGYPGPLGALPLRAALASYLGRVRGVITGPANVLITAGFTQALVLLCGVLRARGVRAIAVEDPCFGFHRHAISAAGLQPIAVPVDEDGIKVGQLAALDVGAVLVAPAHSYPTGAVLSPARRGELLSWVRQHDALIIEDDYDAEFRYDRTPIGALQGLAPRHIVYAGCASKTLTPALRLGWLAAPTQLVHELMSEKLFADMGSPLLEQLALAHFIDSGGFARHLRRVRPVYRRRRDAAIQALSTFLPDAVPTGVAAGLHLYVQLPAGSDERRLVDTAREQGLLLEGASWHWADPDSAPPALVLGYGSLGESAIRDGLARIGSIHNDHRARRG
ncbi:MocR-like pyridoxine biosynthesis transcription factor PdxR [Pseudonocardia sp. Cha107L01]|uniref:MocR-like pyridoxine biosynthesis transcription factor PdxR n=1 Tax=Pseudonocardia sp. Cha107L01 TaxID=3457576 RepID=UPI00403E9470